MARKSIIVPLGETRALDDQEVGSLFYADDGKVYKWVLMDTGTLANTPAAGDALGYLASDTGLTTVCSDESDCINVTGAGAIPSDSSFTVPTDGQYFWMQVRGIITLSTTVGNSPAAGLTIGFSTSDEIFDASPAAGVQPCGYMINATTLVFLDCPF